MKKREFTAEEITVDNRDTSTTELVVRHNGFEIRLEVDPWDLVENLIENAGHSDERTKWLLEQLAEVQAQASTRFEEGV